MLSESVSMMMSENMYDKNSFDAIKFTADDFLPNQQEFAIVYRDRAYSWDISCEGEIHPDLIPPIILNSNNNIVDANSSSCVLTLPNFSKKTSKHNTVTKETDIFIKEEKCIKEEPIDNQLKLVIKGSNKKIISTNLCFDKELLTYASTNLALMEDLIPDIIKSTSNDETFLISKNRSDSVDESIVRDIVPFLANLDSDVCDNDNATNIVNSKTTTSNQSNSLINSTKKTLTSYTGLSGNYNSSHDELKVGVYTKQERQERILRFRTKKMNRIWKKQIKYDCRKRLADTRPRVKGRFVSRSSSNITSSSDGINTIMSTNNNFSCSNQIVNDLSYLTNDNMIDNRRNLNTTAHNKLITSTINTLQPSPFSRVSSDVTTHYYVSDSQSKKIEVLQINISKHDLTK